jgi:hypothetical protein
MTATRTDPAELRAAAQAQLERLRGPQWSSHVEEDDDEDWLTPADEPRQDTSSPVAAEPAARTSSPAATRAKPAASRRKTTATPPAKKPARRPAKKASRAPRRPGRPKSEVPCLPRREVRIPEVVFQRQEAVSEQTGLPPMEALWMLAHLGWCQWSRDQRMTDSGHLRASPESK